MVINHNNYLLELIPQTNNDFELLRHLQAYKKDIKTNKYYVPLSKSVLDELKQYINLSPTLTDLYYKYVLFYNINEVEATLSTDKVLRPYQELAVKWANYTLDNYNFLGLLWAPRTGKTKTGTTIADNYNRVVVLSLAGQDSNWETEFRNSTNKHIFNASGLSKDKRLKVYEDFFKSYNSVLFCSVNTLLKDTKDKTFLPKIMLDLLVIDEVHVLKNTASQLWKNARDLRKKFNKCIGLTGTPVSRGASDLLGIIALLSNGELGKTFLSNYFFHQEYNVFSRYGTAGTLKPEKTNEWLDLLNTYFNQIQKEQALHWETKPKIETIRLRPSLEQIRVYNRLVDYLELETNEGIKQIQEAIAQMGYMNQLATAPSLIRDNIPNIKEEWLLNYIKDNKDKKIIVFTTHTSYLKQLYQTLNRTDVCMITGETKDKTLIAAEYQQGKYNIALCNIQAGSKGITLDTADTIIFLNKDYRPDENLQAAERFSATTPDKVKAGKTIYNLMLDLPDNDYNIDCWIDDIVNHKIKQSDIVNKLKENILKKYEK